MDTDADRRYLDLFDRLGWTEGDRAPDLLRELDVVVGERLVEAEAGVVDAVRCLHAPRSYSGDGYARTCVECRQAWPCATEKALRGVTGGEPAGEWEAWA